jgi:predicted nucleotidyltransferase
VTETPPGLESTLATVESEVGCRVVAARDTGSRARGLAGPDSDYDVDVVFVQPPVRYATLGGYVASVDRTVADGRLEVAGWNVRRFGELLVESNPAALTFLHSPLRYRDHDALAALERDVAGQVDPLGLYHHFRSLVGNQHQKYLRRVLLDDGDPVWVIHDEDETGYEVSPAPSAETTAEASRVEKPTDYSEATTDRTVKRNLHVGRAGLAARYVLAAHEFPPLSFDDLLAEIERLRDDDGRLLPGTDDPAGAVTVHDAWLTTARELAACKRAGEGDATVGDAFGPEFVPPESVDHRAHAGSGPDTALVDDCIERVVWEEVERVASDETEGGVRGEDT